MKKLAKVALLIWVLFFALILCNSDSFAQNHTFLWRVKSETNTVYILGSLHFMKREVYPLDRRIEDAFNASDILVVEANINDIARVDLQKLLDTAFYAGNDTLENHVSAETYALVQKEYEKLGIPLWIVARQKPWFLALTITAFELTKLGFDPNYGIEMHFTSKASGKKIEELESFEYQVNLLSGFSDHEQEMFLLYTLGDIASFKAEADMLLNAWKTGDSARLEGILTRSISQDKRMISIYEKLIYQRNRTMVSKIEALLKGKETCFVIVGAGHLVGEKGIIGLLKRKGYPAEQL